MLSVVRRVLRTEKILGQMYMAREISEELQGK